MLYTLTGILLVENFLSKSSLSQTFIQRNARFSRLGQTRQNSDFLLPLRVNLMNSFSTDVKIFVGGFKLRHQTVPSSSTSSCFPRGCTCFNIKSICEYKVKHRSGCIQVYFVIANGIWNMWSLIFVKKGKEREIQMMM